MSLSKVVGENGRAGVNVLGAVEVEIIIKIIIVIIKIMIIIPMTIKIMIIIIITYKSSSGGTRQSVRECDSPSPKHGGLYCTGDRVRSVARCWKRHRGCCWLAEELFIVLFISVRYESCETQPCSPVSDYRLEQCRAFNGNNFKIEDLPKASSTLSPFSSS